MWAVGSRQYSFKDRFIAYLVADVEYFAIFLPTGFSTLDNCFPWEWLSHCSGTYGECAE